MATNEPTHVITDNPNVVPTGRDLALEAAAVLKALFLNRSERTRSNQQFTLERKALEKRGQEIVDEITNGGTQLAIKFGSTVATTRALASSAPSGDDPDVPVLGNEGVRDTLDEDEDIELGDDDPEDEIGENEALH